MMGIGKKVRYIVRSVSMVFLLIFLLPAALPAQNKTDVILKFSGQGNIFRIVFEAEDSFIQKTRVTTSSTQIRIDFPGYFYLTEQKDFPFEMLVAGRSLVINFKGTPQITFFRLSLPARLVFDIRKKEVQPEKPAAQVHGRGIVIDVGHGGYDFGITYGAKSEKDISLALARDFASALSRRGRKVFLDRKVDQYLSLAERIDFVNRQRPDILISLHSSLSKDFVLYSPGFGESVLSGPADLYSLSSKAKKYMAKSRSLADAIEKAIRKEFNTDVIRRELPLPLLDSAGAPSVLIEYPSPAFMVYDQNMRMRVSDTLINGIAAYEQ